MDTEETKVNQPAGGQDIDLPNQISGQQLKFGYWFTANRLLLRRILIIFLIASGILLWSYVGYRLIMIYAVEDQNWGVISYVLPKNLVNYDSYRQDTQPQQLIIEGTEVLPSGQDRYDFFARVKNPNADWYVASFDYRFILNSGSTETKQGFLLPNEEKYLMDLAINISGVSQARLEIRNIEWRRVNKHQVPDYPSFYQEHFNFDLSDINFTAAGQSAAGTSQVDFMVDNKSAYNFWSVGFQVVLYNGRQIAGVNYISLEQLLAGESRPVHVYWYEGLPGINRVEVVPEVNIFDDKVYMKIEGGAGELK